MGKEAKTQIDPPALGKENVAFDALQLESDSFLQKPVWCDKSNSQLVTTQNCSRLSSASYNITTPRQRFTKQKGEHSQELC